MSTRQEHAGSDGGPVYRGIRLLMRPIIAVLALPAWLLSLFLGQRVRNSIADCGRWWDGLIGPLLFFSFLALIAGIVLPVMRVKKLFMFTNEISLAQSIYKLWHTGEFLLAGLILVFSVLFPALKQFEAYRLWRRISIYDDRFDSRLSRVEWFSKWSMVDVLLIALLILTVKAHKLANATSEPGLYFFTGAIAGTALALTWIGMAASRLRASGRIQYPG